MVRTIVGLLVLAAGILLYWRTTRSDRLDQPAYPDVPIPADAVGRWDGRSMVGPRDSVIAEYRLSVTATPIGVAMQLTGREAQWPRIITAGGDSIVTETGPYDSVARPGFQVTTRTISHFRGDSLFGSFEARYSDGGVTTGRVAGKKLPVRDYKAPRRPGGSRPGRPF